jgi:hypothetical protein
MRLYFAPLAIPAVPFGTGEPTITAPLIAAAGLALGLPTGLPSAVLSAIAMTAVAMTADQDLRPAAGAKKESAGMVRIDTTQPKWTHLFPGAILRAHSCSCTV